jgi:peptidoglycan/LPS O-acetylase OafA/YrhL
MTRQLQGWRIAYYTLLAVWVCDAVLVMARVRAGFFTSYAADLALPAWLYIVARHLHDSKSRSVLNRVLGRSPEMAAGALFLASVASEVSQRLWPSGFFAGRFDPFDIVAYAVGIGICYAVDKRSRSRGPATANVS